MRKLSLIILFLFIGVTVYAGFGSGQPPGAGEDGMGDMLKTTYDTGDNGIVDNSDALDTYKPEVATSTGNLHQENLDTAVSTGTNRQGILDVGVTTGTNHQDILNVGVSTGVNNQGLLNVGITTAANHQDILNVGVSTGANKAEIDAIALSTQTFEAVAASTTTLEQEIANIVNLSTGVPGTFFARSGEAITKGQLVYVSGSVGSQVQVSLADAYSAGMDEAIGFATETVGNNQQILIITNGLLDGIPTDHVVAGVDLYLHSVGSFDDVRPSSGTVQHVGQAGRSHATLGNLIAHIDPAEPYLAAGVGESVDIRMGVDGGVIHMEDGNDNHLWDIAPSSINFFVPYDMENLRRLDADVISADQVTSTTSITTPELFVTTIAAVTVIHVEIGGIVVATFTITGIMAKQMSIGETASDGTDRLAVEESVKINGAGVQPRVHFNVSSMHRYLLMNASGDMFWKSNDNTTVTWMLSDAGDLDIKEGQLAAWKRLSYQTAFGSGTLTSLGDVYFGTRSTITADGRAGLSAESKQLSLFDRDSADPRDEFRFDHNNSVLAISFFDDSATAITGRFLMAQNGDFNIGGDFSPDGQFSVQSTKDLDSFVVKITSQNADLLWGLSQDGHSTQRGSLTVSSASVNGKMNVASTLAVGAGGMTVTGDFIITSGDLRLNSDDIGLDRNGRFNIQHTTSGDDRTVFSFGLGPVGTSHGTAHFCDYIDRDFPWPSKLLTDVAIKMHSTDDSDTSKYVVMTSSNWFDGSANVDGTAYFESGKEDMVFSVPDQKDINIVVGTQTWVFNWANMIRQ